jgi:adenylate cyclase
MLELAYKDGGQDKVYPVRKEEIVLGRAPQADIVLNDHSVSRIHAIISFKGNEITIRDEKSRNGTRVNKVDVLEAPLQPGDRLVLGNFELELRESRTAVENVLLEEKPGILESSGAVIRRPQELEQLLQAPVPSAEKAPPAVIDELERNNRILRMVSQVAQALISEDSLDGLLHKVMDLVFENIAGARGMLGLFEGEQLVPRVVKYRETPPEGDKIQIPRSIPQRVRSDKVSVLVTDALSDQRFDPSASIVRMGVRSAMCVPLWDRDRVIGIIYVDEGFRAGTYSATDLDLLGAFANYAAVAIERQRLTEKVQEEQATRAKLERYHSPGVIETILKGGGPTDRLVMQECAATVCFTDLVGFTTMAEGLEPQDVGRTINEYFGELTECIFKYEGTLDKYIGDCIMAVFGAPLPQADHAIRGVRAALEMHRMVDELNAERGDLPQIQLRTGINSGRVVAGDIGSPKRKDYSVLGDTVNLASRLEGHVAQPTWIVIGENTYAEVKDYFECESLGPQTVKGKKREIGAYRVLREKPGAFPAKADVEPAREGASPPPP